MATVTQGPRAVRPAHNHQAGQHHQAVPIREVQAAHRATQQGAALIPILHLQEAVLPIRTQHLQEAVLRVAIRAADLHRAVEAAVEAAVAADQDADDNKIALKKSLKEIKTMVLELAPIIGAGFTQPLKNIYK